MKKTVLILITLCISIIGYSQTFIDNYITYSVTSTTNNTVQTIYYDTAGGTSVSIPATVTNSSTGISYSVTRINNYSFGQKNLVSVTIPNSVTSIGLQAFFINYLTSITIPDSVTTIEDYAFQNNNITQVTIPQNVINIGNGSFRSNPLTCIISEATTPPIITTGGVNDTFNSNRSAINLTIPISTLSAYISGGWTGFASVTEGLSDTFVVDNITYLINPNPYNEVTVTDYNTAGGTVVNIPASVNSGCTDFSVVSIGTNAFISKNLTNVTIPNTVTSIGTRAFRWNSLTSVVIPSSVNSIGSKAFMQNQITSVTIPPNSVGYIGEQAFRVNQLASVTIPDSVTTIGIYAFADNLLTNVTLSNNITQISEGLFRNNQLSNITIPVSVTSFGPNSFSVNQFTNFSFTDSITSIGGDAFAQNQLTNINISDSVTNIANYAFQNNQLTNITIPGNVTNIGHGAFYNNPLTNVTSISTTPPIIITGGSTDTFGNNRNTIDLHIPNGTMGVYVTDAGALWTGFNSVAENTLSTSDFELTNDIKIITTTDEIRITFSSNIRLQNYTMYNISGVKVSIGNKSKIPTTHLSSGIYIIKLDFNKRTFFKKIIIK